MTTTDEWRASIFIRRDAAKLVYERQAEKVKNLQADLAFAVEEMEHDLAALCDIYESIRRDYLHPGSENNA